MVIMSAEEEYERYREYVRRMRDDSSTSTGNTTSTITSYAGDPLYAFNPESFTMPERRTQNMQTIIFGCGGVGSNLAYMLSKDPAIGRIYLVDHDTIEMGNLARQFFIKEDVGKNKAEALATTLKQFSPDKEYIALPIKIENEGDLGQFPRRNDRNTFAFVCTDNIESKTLISHYFRNTICLGCDVDLVELRRNFDGRSVWSVGGGYNSTQTFESNMFAAAIGYMLFVRGHWSINHRKVQISRFIHELVEKGFEAQRRRE